MRKQIISVETEWEMPARYSLIQHNEPSNGIAVVFPGTNYPCTAPLLDFCSQVALQKGLDVLLLEYGFQSNHLDEIDNRIVSSVNEFMSMMQPYVERYKQHVFISKSIGTVIASALSKKLGVEPRHIYLTPLKETIESIICNNRSLVIVGDRDKFFADEDINQIGGRENVIVHVVANANHALRINGNYRASLNVLSNVANWCADFISFST